MALDLKRCPRLVLKMTQDGPTVTPKFPPSSDRGLLGDFVYERRLKLDLTQEQLGARANPPLRSGMISRVEWGYAENLTLGDLTALGDALGVAPGTLLELWMTQGVMGRHQAERCPRHDQVIDSWGRCMGCEDEHHEDYA